MKTFLILLFLTVSLTAQEMVNVTLAWDQNPEPDISHYRLYVGTSSGVYGPSIPVGETTKTLSLPKNVLHFAVVTAVNTSGLESPGSKELCFQVFTTGEGKAPSQPVGLKKTGSISISIEKSEDLQIWHPIHNQIEVVTNQNTFFRLALAP